ncbi:putative UDP-glucose glucosyltransferase [Hibiscus syriacus]|uniref:putative UDP-glucose glucosyltransferase n=1 Tax=Hibiscus syriacus TaxID=106335 RepID=UPI0019214D2C|nr:putative UDP-glucose glucosyltransferase [Hibiscus syriacus]
MGLEAVAMWPAGAPCLALAAHVPILLQDKIINSDGIIMKDELIILSEDVPACAWSSSDIGWRSSHPITSKALLGFYSIVPYGFSHLRVVGPNFTDGSTAKFPDGFRDRVSDWARIVEWVPQEMVLAHSSVSCFLSHCGWNSNMEGLTMGVPFLRWPYIADQFSNKKYVCEDWFGVEQR